jgi:hypothetical protein
MTSKNAGKGGNIDTRPNPFGKIQRQTERSFGLADCPDALRMLDTLIQAGCAAIIGATRDGGALVLTVLDGDTRHRTYCSTIEELDEAVTALTIYYTQP